MSDRAQRIFLWVFALLLVVGTGLALRYARGYRPLAGLRDGGPAFPADIGIRLEKVKVIGRQKGKAAWTVKAGRIETARIRSQFRFGGGIEAALLDKGKPMATLTAPSATYDDIVQALTVTGDIDCRIRQTRLKGPLRVTAKSLSWDAGSDTVRCPGPVRAIHPKGQVWGENLTINLKTNEYTLRNVRGEFLVDPSGEIPL